MEFEFEDVFHREDGNNGRRNSVLLEPDCLPPSEPLTQPLDEQENAKSNFENGEYSLDFTGNPVKERVTKADFQVLKVIGRGGFGKVLLVSKTKTHEILAMKVLRKDFLIETNNVEYSIAERDILRQVRHPYIVGLHYAFQTKGRIYLVMDYMNGGQLLFHLKKQAMFTEDLARFYAAEVVLAIEHLHGMGIAHRDLKPENILLDNEGHIALTDFGFAKEMGTEISKTFCGTLEYMAPEILLKKGHDKSVDWWSLGILMYDMMTGKPPFRHNNQGTLTQKIIKEKARMPPFLSREAHSVIGGLLQKDPKKRLGCGPKGIAGLKSHPFFKPINWVLMSARGVPPPFRPETKRGKADWANFDKCFTNLPLVDSPEGSLTASQEGLFKNFSYIRGSTPPPVDAATPEDLETHLVA